MWISQPVCRREEILGTASHCSIPVRIPRLLGMPSPEKASFPRSHPQKNAANLRKQGKFTSSSTSPAAQGRQIAQPALECRTGPISGRTVFSPPKQGYFFLHISLDHSWVSSCSGKMRQEHSQTRVQG